MYNFCIGFTACYPSAGPPTLAAQLVQVHTVPWKRASP